MYRASNIQYEHSDRVRGLASGGIGAMHQLAQHTGLVEAIDRHVQVLKVVTTIERRGQRDSIPTGEVRAAIARRFTSSAEPQTRLL